MEIGIIYKAVNQVNNKIYIGQTTKGLQYRKKGHFYTAQKQRDKAIFHKALCKYSRSNFKWNVLWTGDVSLLDKKEEYYIRLNNCCCVDGYGYNMSYGGEGQGNDRFNANYNHNVFTFYHISGKTEKNITKHNFHIKHNIPRYRVNELISGKIISCKGWVFDKKLLNKAVPKGDKRGILYTFIHNTGIVEKNITQSLLCKKYNLNSSNTSLLVNGKINIIKGWKIKMA